MSHESEEMDGGLSSPLVLQCEQCRSILGDTTSFSASDEELAVICLSRCSSVSIAEELRTSKMGKDSGSTFAELRCANCGANVGRLYRTTPKCLDHFRERFSLFTSSIRSYSLGSGELQCNDDIEGGVGGGNGSIKIEESIHSGELTQLRDEVGELKDELVKIEKMILVFNERMDSIEGKQRKMAEGERSKTKKRKSISP